MGLLIHRQQLLLFFSFEGFICLCCVLFFIQNNRPYQSTLVKVAGDIYTPAAVGQYQHGSSRWLKNDEKDKVFKTMLIDPLNPIIKMLLDTGYDNSPFMQTQLQERFGSLTTIPIKNSQEVQDENFETVAYNIEDINLKSIQNMVKTTGNSTEKEKVDPYKLFPNGGIVIGMTKEGKNEKLHYIADDTHTLTIGATRSGKTRCLVLQSICALGLSAESLVISDPKAEIYHYTAAYLKKLDYEVICLDFKNPEKSTRYNLLQPVIDAVNEQDMERAEMYAWNITNILVGNNTSNEKIWENGEKSTIAAAILCVVVDNVKRPEYQNLTNVYWFIAEMSKTINGKTPMQEYMKKLPNNHPARAIMSIANVAPSHTKGSFDTSALTTLRLFTTQSVYAITHMSDYNISEIGQKNKLYSLSPVYKIIKRSLVEKVDG